MTLTAIAPGAGSFEPILRGERRFRLRIHDRERNHIGYLEPLTNLTADRAVVEQMTRWRNLAKRAFLTQFDATPERTRKWLAEVVFTDHARLIFLIRSLDRIVGHVGLRDLTDDNVQLDNTLRGERGGPPELMLMAHASLMNWVLEEFTVQSFYCYVFEDNSLVLKLHDALGLRVVARIPLELDVTSKMRAFRLGNPGETSLIDRYYLRLGVTRTAFRQASRELGQKEPSVFENL